MDLPPARARRLLGIPQLDIAVRTIWIHEVPDQGSSKYQIVQQPESLCTQRRATRAYHSDVAARSVEAGDQAVFDGIAADRDDRYGRGCLLGRESCDRATERSNHCYTSVDQFGCQLWQSRIYALRPAERDVYILTFEVAGFFKTLAECGDKMRRLVGRPAAQKADYGRRLLLRARRERPRRRRAAECGQQFPPSDGDCHAPLPCEGA